MLYFLLIFDIIKNIEEFFTGTLVIITITSRDKSVRTSGSGLRLVSVIRTKSTEYDQFLHA